MAAVQTLQRAAQTGADAFHEAYSAAVRSPDTVRVLRCLPGWPSLHRDAAFLYFAGLN